MAFFEKVGGTLAAKGRDVADKAKEMAEVNRLNGQIHSQTNAAEKIYAEIGKMVCEHREKWGQVDATEQLEQLDSIQAEIARLQEEILRVKGIRKCENCGAAIDMRLSYCPECGVTIAAETSETEAEGQQGLEELQSQGSQQGRKEQQSQEEQESQEDQQRWEEQKNQNGQQGREALRGQEERQGREELQNQKGQADIFCQGCHKKLERGMMFCPFCGRKQK